MGPGLFLHTGALPPLLTHSLPSPPSSLPSLRAPAGYYILFDSPGQAELYTHHTSLAAIVARLSRELDLRLAAVHLVDAHHCGDPFKFVAAALVSLNAMVRLELPHINALSKVDLKEVFAKSGLGLDDFTDLMDLHRMLPTLEDADAAEAEEEAEAEAERQARATSAEGEGGLGGGAAPASSSSSSVPYIPGKVRPKFPARTRDFVRKFQRLNERLVELVTDFNLVNFTPISCRDAPSLLALVKKVDKANGFVLLKTAAAGRPPPKQQQRAGAGAREGGEAEGAPQPPTHTRRQHAAGGSGISSLPPLVPSSSSSRFEGAGQTVRSAAAALTGRVLLEEADEDEDDEDDDGEGGGQGAGRSSWRGAAAEDEG